MASRRQGVEAGELRGDVGDEGPDAVDDGPGHPDALEPVPRLVRLVLVAGQLYADDGDAKPLTADEMSRFELRPSLLNLDVYQAMSEQAQIVGQWERRCKIPAEKRVTQWKGATGTYAPAKGILPEQLAERCRQAKEFPDGPIRHTGAVRPRPHRDR
mgnify:CR=1 FL=1